LIQDPELGELIVESLTLGTKLSLVETDTLTLKRILGLFRSPLGEFRGLFEFVLIRRDTGGLVLIPLPSTPLKLDPSRF
jgi:hypothetical protein